MTTADERLKILNMVAEGKITAEEGAQLLSALRSTDRRAAGSGGMESGSPRVLRVRVTDSRTGRTKANINIPVSLLHVAVRIGAKFAPDLEGVDFQELMEIINQGGRGKIIDVSDEDGTERVEIYAE
jgi:hypothetical protein